MTGELLLGAEVSDKEIVKMIEQVRIGDRIVKDGQEYYIINGYIGEKELKAAGKLIKYDENLKEYITQHPQEFIKLAIKNGALIGDVLAAQKYLAAVKNGRYNLAEQIDIAWRAFNNMVNDKVKDILSKAKFVGKFWESKVWLNKKGLYLSGMPKQLSHNPPVYRTLYEDEQGNKYFGLSAIPLSGEETPVVIWKLEDIANESKVDVIDAYKVALYQQVLFTGMGRVIESGKIKNMLYTLIDFVKYDIIRDEKENKYILNVGLDMGEFILPVLSEEFDDLKKALKFLKEEVIQKYFEFEEKIEKMFGIDRQMSKDKDNDIGIGGMYV